MKRFCRFYAILALLLAVCLMVPTAFGQTLVSGDLSGTVTDPTGAVVANAAVALKERCDGRNPHHDNQLDRSLPIFPLESGKLHRRRVCPRVQ